MSLKKIKIFKIKNVKISLFFVNYRGLNVLNYLLKKKLNITHVFLSKRNLNNKITPSRYGWQRFVVWNPFVSSWTLIRFSKFEN